MSCRAMAQSALLIGLSLLVSPGASATAQRTFVASYGAAANTAFNCSIAKPCRSFADAIGVTSAQGEVVVLDSAGYGPVTITESVSIIAPAGIYAGVSVLTNDGVVIDAPGAIVVLRGLSINGQGGTAGVRVQHAARVRIEGCTISGMTATGIDHAAAGAEMIVVDSIVRDNGSTGISVVADAFTAIDRTRVEHNGADGLYAQATSADARVMITDSLFAGNGQNGINAGSLFSSSKTYVQVERSMLADNGAAGLRAGGAGLSFVTVAMSRSALQRNGTEAVHVDG